MLALFSLLLVALTISLVSTPRIRQFALAIGFVDRPTAHKNHANATPLLGGVGIFGGFIIVATFYFAWQGNWRIIGILLAALLMVIIGIIDDRRALSGWAKWGGQLLSFIIAAQLGTQVQLPIHPFFNFLLTIIWFSIVTNAVNFTDNMDGLCAGNTAVACAFIMLFATFSNQFLIAPLAAILLGACLGFLRYNFRPAQIFMGDAGSLLLGFLLAYMALQLRFPDNINTVTWIVPILLLGVPLFDLALVTVIRLRKRVNPLTTSTKDHLSQQFVRWGYSIGESVLLNYLLGCAFGLIALFIARARPIDAYLLIFSLLLVASYAIYRFNQTS